MACLGRFVFLMGFGVLVRGLCSIRFPGEFLSSLGDYVTIDGNELHAANC